MKPPIVIIVSVLAIVSLLLPSGLLAESQAEKYLSEREMCLDVVRIKETRILDDRTILFETYGGAIYISRLPADCHGLRIGGGFFYDTSNSRLCKQDIIKVIEPGPSLGSTCGMGEFVRLKEVSTLSDAVKLLENGTLEALIEEDVFETAFPRETEK